ncbi:MAG: polysaccharide pyruvyl transferase family protein [Paramuribaculum sp.]|nr:polysaccharide pyruvyl transferase family protein [Paramuribaculum sp.]
MHYDTKINELRAIIASKLSPVIGDKCIIADAPYYANIGDVLIWQGTEDFLLSENKTIISTNSNCTFTFPKLDSDVTIILMGGGNFGDLWRWFQDARLKIISHYPHNRIVMLPQSVWYNADSLIDRDATVFARHNDLYLCARDNYSYQFLLKHFSANHILLVPDMAFHINENRLETFRHHDSGKSLFFRRLDKELSDSTPEILQNHTDIRDWPTMEKLPLKLLLLNYALRITNRLHPLHFLHKIISKPIDIIAQKAFKSHLVTEGCRFLSQYTNVTSSRLHAMILAFLLHKPVTFIDNTTGKLSAFADTWLTDSPYISKYESD